MVNNNHIVISDEAFELINKKYAELIIKGYKIPMGEIANRAIKKGISDIEDALSDNGNMKDMKE